MTEKKSEIDLAIDTARETWLRIANQSSNHEVSRLRGWITKAIIGAFVSLIGMLFLNYPLDIGISNINAARLAAIAASLGLLSFVYFGLQIFLDGLLARLISMRAAPDPSNKNNDTLETSNANTIASDNSEQAVPRRILPKYLSIASGIRIRLRKEINNQGSKAQANLGMGVITALLAIGFLGWLAWGVSQPSPLSDTDFRNIEVNQFRKMNFWALILAKFALSATASVFSFFFLSTYRRNLGEIKYFQNEMTNVESKIFSIYMADHLKMTGVIETILLKISDTERNFIIKNGEKTIDMHSRELDSGDYNTSVKHILEALRLNKNDSIV